MSRFPENTKPTLAVIEQSMKDAINAVGKSYIKTVETYAGDFNVSSQEDFALVVSKFPAVWVTWKNSERIAKKGRKWQVKHNFVVIVGAKSARSEQVARHGAFKKAGNEIKRLSVGSYQLIEDVETALIGQDLGLSIEAFEPQRVTPFISDNSLKENVSVMAYELSTTVLKAKAEDDEEHYMETVSVDYIDGEAVIASDRITLSASNASQ